MEAAFVYGTTYKFFLTTETALLESIGYVQEAYVNGFVCFFHITYSTSPSDSRIMDLEGNCKQMWIYKWNWKSPSLLLSAILQSANEIKCAQVMLG